MIRCATKADILDIIPLIKLFSKRIRQEDNFNLKEVANALAHMIDNGVLIIGVKDDEIIGLAGGTFGSSIWNPHIKLFSEEIFYVLPRYRGREMSYELISELTNQAITQDAKMLAVKKMYNSPNLDNLYGSLGYKKLETTYMMEI